MDGDSEPELDPREAARVRRRDRDATAAEREPMRTGLSKQFKQVLDAQVKRANEAGASRKADLSGERRSDASGKRGGRPKA